MKNIIFWIFGLSVIVFGVYYFNKNDAEPIKLSRHTLAKISKGHKAYDDFFWKDYNRIISLTSNKFHIKDSVTRNIVLEYLRINYPNEYFILTRDWIEKDTTVLKHILSPSETVNETIQRLSSNYKISKDSLNELLFDFELWCSTMKLYKE